MDKVKKNINSSETTRHKRERSVNFTQKETELLVSLVGSKKRIIESKKNDATTWKDKEKAWNDIEKEFNIASKSVFRNHKHLKQKYEAIKRDTRKKSAVTEADHSKNVTDTSTAPVFTSAEKKVKEMIVLSAEGNESCFDSDSALSTCSNNIFREIIEEDHCPEPASKFCEVTKEEKLQCKSKGKSQFDILIEEKIEIAKIQKKMLTEELEQKLIQRKILEKELKHKDVMHDLEKQHLLLKINLLENILEEKS